MSKKITDTTLSHVFIFWVHYIRATNAAACSLQMLTVRWQTRRVWPGTVQSLSALFSLTSRSPSVLSGGLAPLYIVLSHCTLSAGEFAVCAVWLCTVQSLWSLFSLTARSPPARSGGLKPLRTRTYRELRLFDECALWNVQSVRAKKWITCILKVCVIRLCPQSELNLLKIVSELKDADKINMLRSMIGG